MLKIIKPFSIKIILTLISLVVLGIADHPHSMDKPESKVTEFKAEILPGFEDLPSIYKHRPLAEQIKEYRRIYDEAYNYKAPYAERVEACKRIIGESIKRMYKTYGLDMEEAEAKKILFEMLSQVNELEQDALESYMKEASEFLLNHVPPGKLESARLSANIPYWYNYEYKKERIKKGPIPGLFGVLENAVALANFYITTDTDGKRINKISYIQCLKIIWDDIKNHKENINSRLFQLYNKIIACIIDSYKEQLAIKNLEGAKNGPTMHYADLLNYYLSMSNAGYRNMYLSNYVVFILYGRPENVPGRAISPIHFVRELLTGKYEAYIALFDVLSTPRKKATKMDPHWSLENGTEKMLNHDLEHINRQSVMFDFYIFNDFYKNAYLTKIYSIYQLYYSAARLNEAKILLNGLFIITHESPQIIERKNNLENFSDFIKALVNKYENRMVSEDYKINLSKGLPFRYDTQYKQEYRDWEFIIRDTYGPNHEPVHDAEGIPLYNAVKESTQGEKEKAVMEGYSRFWAYFENLVLNYEQNLKS